MGNADMQVVTDYAMPMMKIEKLLRDMHELCLNQKYIEACDLTQHVLVEARILSATLAIMHENALKMRDTK
jgi:hypothetical protein